MKLVIILSTILLVFIALYSVIVQYIVTLMSIERNTKKVVATIIVAIALVICTTWVELEVDSLYNELEAQNAIVDELQDEVGTLEVLLEKKFNDAAPPRVSSNIYYDIKLPKELQLYTYQCCNYFDIDYKIFLSLMYVESRYDINANNGDQYIGLVQMSVDNIEYIERELGTDIDIYNPYDNILAGTFWLSRYAAKYPDDVCMQLQCYNMGEAGAKEDINNTAYYNKILSYYLTF